MNKELKALEKLGNIDVLYNRNGIENCYSIKDTDEFEIIERALKEVSGEDRVFLRHIKNGKLHPLTTKCYQDLLKSKKALEIIKNKIIPYSPINRTMVQRAFDEGWIAKEEYDFLQEVLL